MSDSIDRDPEALAHARAALDAHLSNPDLVREDRAQAGGIVRRVTTAVGGLAALAIVAAIVAATSKREALPLAVMIAIVLSILALVLFLVDLSIVPRDQPSAPDDALKSWLKAIAIGRVGYAWSALAPTARERVVRAPVLGEVVTGQGEFSMARPEGLKAYLATFARAGGGQMRNVVIKRVKIASAPEDGVAKVEAELSFNSWPRWVSVLLALGFALFRLMGPVIAIALVVYFIKRKRHDLTIVKTVIRGRDDAWYVADADILEGVASA